MRPSRGCSEMACIKTRSLAEGDGGGIAFRRTVAQALRQMDATSTAITKALIRNLPLLFWPSLSILVFS